MLRVLSMPCSLCAFPHFIFRAPTRRENSHSTVFLRFSTNTPPKLGSKENIWVLWDLGMKFEALYFRLKLHTNVAFYSIIPVLI